MTKKNKPLFGYKEEATYSDSEIPFYAGNPLIEALPPLKSRSEIMQQLARFPTFHPDDRAKPEQIRLAMLTSLDTMYQPFNKSIVIAQTIHSMIRAGYQERNPLNRMFWKDINQRVADVDTPFLARPTIPSTASGMGIIGVPGMGKTATQNRTLSGYLQVIFHTAYHDQPFPFQQLVWLKQDIPHDGSIRGFCLQYFQDYDFIFGTNYYAAYARNGRATIDEMIPRMARVASLHGQGIQIIDETQDLHSANSGGSEKILRFLVNFANVVGIPLVFTGTPDSLLFLQGKLHMIRRVEDQGCFLWDRMRPDDPDWTTLCEALWNYQYVRHPVQLTDGLKQALFDACQGITSYAVGIFRDAQKWAILNGSETLTENLFGEVAESTRSLSGEVRAAFAVSDTHAASLVGDVKMTNDDVATPLLPGQKQEVTTTRTSRTPRRSNAVNLSEDSLVRIVEEGDSRAIAAYDALREANCIRSPSEFFEVPT